jgi:20S proteasome subunit alpha 7
LSDRLGLYLNAYTLYGSYRPLGSAEIIASYDKYDGFGLYMLEPNGLYYGYSACTTGKGRQLAKSEFEKRNFDKLTCK